MLCVLRIGVVLQLEPSRSFGMETYEHSFNTSPEMLRLTLEGLFPHLKYLECLFSTSASARV